MAEISGVKRSIPTELCEQTDEIKEKVAKTTGSLLHLDDNYKRWQKVGIGLHKIISPLLRKYIKPRLYHLWLTLKNFDNIDTQQYPNQLKSLLSTSLNYKAINNNKVSGLRQEKFDYRVKDSVDLSKLFLQTNSTQYAAFDESCCLPSLLGILINSGICPSSTSDLARKVRSDIRNLWSHCNFTEWCKTKYGKSFDLIDCFIKNLGLSIQDENEAVSNLYRLHVEGKMFIKGTMHEYVDLEDLKELIPLAVKNLKDQVDGKRHKAEVLLSRLKDQRLDSKLPLEKTVSDISTSLIVDKRLEHRLTDVKDSKLRVEKRLSHNYTSLIVDKRLEYRLTDIEVIQMADLPCTDIVRRITNCDPFNSLCKLQSVSNIEKILMNDTIINLILEYIRRSHDSHLKFDLPCRYLLSLIDLSKSSIVRELHKCLINAISLSESQIAKAIAWTIVRMFVGNHRDLQYFDIWPGVECCCQDEMQGFNSTKKHCNSEKVLIFVEVNAKTDFIKLQSFHGVPVKWEIVNGYSLEAAAITKYINETAASDTTCTQDIEGLSNDEAKELFSHHRNLALISKSSVKSIEFVEGGQHKFSTMPCIQLYCRVKGLIPIGEQHFPRTMKQIQTDVIQGFSQLLVQQISVGDEIGLLSAGTGTLGGFVRYRGEDALLTCAHVILPRNLLVPDPDFASINDFKMNVFCKNNSSPRPFQCGTLADHMFPPDIKEGVSIDAAVIKLENCRIQSLGPAKKYLNYSVLDYREIGINTPFCYEAVGLVSSLQSGQCEVGIEKPTSVEFETLNSCVNKTLQEVQNAGLKDQAHLALKIASDIKKNRPRDVLMYNQISLSNIKFVQGDSGMCIYGKDKGGKVGCIGMAIASHPDGGCIVTPMKSILSAFKM